MYKYELNKKIVGANHI